MVAGGKGFHYNNVHAIMACKKFDILTIALLLIPERGNRPNCHVRMAIGADGYDRDGRFGCRLPSIGSQQMSYCPAIDHLLRTNMTHIASTSLSLDPLYRMSTARTN